MQGKYMPDCVATNTRFRTESPVTIIMLQNTLSLNNRNEQSEVNFKL